MLRRRKQKSRRIFFQKIVKISAPERTSLIFLRMVVLGWILCVLALGLKGFAVQGLSVWVPETTEVGLCQLLNLSCSVDINDTEKLLSISWQRADSNGSYVSLITFNLDRSQNSSLIEYGTEENSLKTRLSGENVNEKLFVLLLNNTECGDEGSYRCVVKYSDNSQGVEWMHAPESSVRITASAFKTVNMTITPDVTSTEENATLEFSCSVDLGRPAPDINETVLWQLHRYGVNNPVLLMGSTIITNVTGSCTFMAISKMTHAFTLEDNKAVVKCIVWSDSDIYSQTDEILVSKKSVTKCKMPFLPNEQTHALQDVGKQDFNVGEVLTLVCDEGYQLNGRDRYQCFASGYWDSDVIPCTKVDGHTFTLEIAFVVVTAVLLLIFGLAICYIYRMRKKQDKLLQRRMFSKAKCNCNTKNECCCNNSAFSEKL